MKPKLFICYIYFFYSSGAIAACAMADNNGNVQQPPAAMEFLQLPADSIANIGSFLDDSSLTAFKQTCRYCYSILSEPNPFYKCPPQVLEHIIRNCSQNDLINLWRTSKYFYIRFVDHEQPFRIRCDNYYPYFPQKGTATHQMIMHIRKLITDAQHHRSMDISLNLSGQAQRPGLDQKLFIPRLFALLLWDNTTPSIAELDLSRNFTKNFPICLMHRKLIQSNTQHNPAAMNAINIACSFSPNLTKLILDGNDLVAIPGQVARLAKLRILSLAWNYLKPQSLEPCRHMDSLIELNLTRNCLTMIPQFLRLLVNLRVLNVSDNPLDKETKQRLAKERNEKLTILFSNE